LYENADASPGAVVVDPSVAETDLPVYDGCENERVLCRDFASVADHRRGGAVAVTHRPNEIRVGLESVNTPAMLVVAEMFRRGWSAASATQALTPRSVYGGLIGVPLPAGTTEVRLTYRPLAPRAAALARGIGLLVGIGLIAGLFRA
jgi:uncharacterized membrane protein YfhO